MIGDAGELGADHAQAPARRAHRRAALVEDDGEHVKLKEVVSDADDITEEPRLANAGVLGAVLRDRQPLLVAATKPGQLPYYDGKRAGVALVAVPIIEPSASALSSPNAQPPASAGYLRGVLAADRDAPFAEADRDLLADAAAQLLRVVQAEQVFRAVERAKYEYERFYQATAMLGRALTPDQVMATAFRRRGRDRRVRRSSVIALYDRVKARHRVAAVRIRPGGEGVIDEAQVTNLEFKDNAGLASMVVKNRHYLLRGRRAAQVSAPIYTRKIKVDDARSLLSRCSPPGRADRYAYVDRARREAVRHRRARHASP